MSLPPPDVEAFFQDLAKAFVSPNYTAEDRYREFRKVFLSDETGKRVLYQVLAWGHMFRNSAALAKHDPYQTQFYEGERNLAQRVWAAIHQQPRGDRPTKQNSKRTPNASQE